MAEPGLTYTDGRRWLQVSAMPWSRPSQPPLDALPGAPTASGTVDSLVTFNAVRVDAGEWAGPKGDHNVSKLRQAHSSMSSG